GRRYVQLDAALVDTFATDPAAFRAVVLHELAHLRNRDVDVTYLTIAIWRSFVALAVLPLVLLLLHPSLFATPLRWRLAELSPSLLLRAGVAMLVLAGLVYLTRNAVLRTRELYADARTAGFAPTALRG